MGIKISVIIPIYNVEKYLEEAIKSIINQSIGFKDNIQLILVNDGSTDNCEKICHKYQNQYPDNIIYIYQENQGVSAVRNTGIKYIKGKYVNFLDGDDKWNIDAFKYAYKFFEQHYDEIDVLVTRIKFFEKNNDYHLLDYRFNKGTQIVDLNEDSQKFNIQLTATSTFIKSSEIGRVRFDTNLKFGEDILFINTVILNKCKIGFIKESIYLYRKRKEHNSAVDSQIFDKSYYLDTPLKSHLGLINYSLKKFDKVLPYIQAVIAYDLLWRFDLLQIYKVLNTKEYLEFYKLSHKILSYIDDEILINNPIHKSERKRCVAITIKTNKLPGGLQMKYVIMCGGYYEHWKTPKHLQVVNGECIVERTIRLLKELGVKDISITSNDKRFDGLGVPRLEHENSYRYEDIKNPKDEQSGILKGYWLDAFYPNFPKNTKVTYLYGDVYYTENALHTIVEYIDSDIKKNMFFSTDWEPLAYRVNDYAAFMKGVKEVKQLQDEGKVTRKNGVAITWELYRYLNGIDINKHEFVPGTYVKINDGSKDADWTSELKVLNKNMNIMKNVFYFSNIKAIGGIETFFYQLARQYQKEDIVIYYKKGDPLQVERLNKYICTRQYQGETIKCERAFFCFNLEIIDKVQAKEYIQIIHGDYKALKIALPSSSPKITKYLGVSQVVCDTYKELTGKELELCYNPTFVPKPRKVLNLISATRLSKEKGKDRIVKLAELLDAANIPYIWTIFTDDKKVIDNPNIVYMKTRLDITDYIANADYLVQLSDSEGYCFSVIESLMLSTPVIVTDCPVYKELGLNEKNSFILDFDLQNVPIDKIYEGLPSFKYTPQKDSWDKYILKRNKDSVKVKTIKKYKDMELNRVNFPSEAPFYVRQDRAEELVAANVCEIVVE